MSAICSSSAARRRGWRALRKLLAAGPDLRARELRAALGVDLPLDVVEALLALAPRDGVLSETERIVADALRRESGAGTVRRLARFVEPAGITLTTTAVCLSRSPLFRRLERGRWALAV